MNYYRVKFKKPAERFLFAHKAVAVRFMKAFDDLCSDVSQMAFYDIVRMQNTATPTFRLRIGKYRAIFRVHHDELIILVMDIDSRGGIYK